MVILLLIIMVKLITEMVKMIVMMVGMLITMTMIITITRRTRGYSTDKMRGTLLTVFHPPPAFSLFLSLSLPHSLYLSL